MHAHYKSPNGVVVVSAFEHAIEPVQLFTREDACRVVEVNEVSLTPDPVVVGRGGQVRSRSDFAARPGLGSGNLCHILALHLKTWCQQPVFELGEIGCSLRRNQFMIADPKIKAGGAERNNLMIDEVLPSILMVGLAAERLAGLLRRPGHILVIL